MVLKALLPAKSNTFNSDTLFGSFYSELNQFKFKFERQDINNQLINFKQQLRISMYGDQPYIYHAKLLEVLKMTSRGVEGFNRNNARLRKTFSLKYLLELMLEPDGLSKRFSDNSIIPGRKHAQTADNQSLFPINMTNEEKLEGKEFLNVFIYRTARENKYVFLFFHLKVIFLWLIFLRLA